MRGVEQIPWLYDLGLALAERTGFGRWRRWLAAGARGRALDLGSGTGRNLPLLPAAARPVAVDPHPDNLARARRRAPGVPLVLARACLSPRAIQRYFGITTQALEYFHDPVRHDTTQATRDLGALGVKCPRLADYLPQLISFYRSHKGEVRQHAMS